MVEQTAMTLDERWLLPEGITEVLPAEAARLESLRRRVIDLFRVWGYDLVMPPMIDHLESLLTGVGNDLDLQTFKLTDQLSGRMLGVRADMTPQVARIDAHHFDGSEPRRLCYLGTVLHTRPDGHAGSRSLLQVGAELYGHSGVDSDLEVVRLMLDTIGLAGLDGVSVDIGHMGVFRGLVDEAGLDPERETLLFDVLQRKAVPELTALLHAWSLSTTSRSMLLGLCRMYGDRDVIGQARALLAPAGAPVLGALDTLGLLIDRLARTAPQARIHIDLADLRGYHYHTGVMFRAYVCGQGRAIAAGGRYDNIGRYFGRARPATGFSTDLRTLVALGSPASPGTDGVLAPAGDDEALARAIAGLRARGERVVVALSDTANEPERMGCSRLLAQQGESWTVVPIESREED